MNNSLTIRNFFANTFVKNSFVDISSIAKQILTLSLIKRQTFKSIIFKDLEFRYRNDLIYYINKLNNERERFCILKSLFNKIFALTYNRLSHVDYHKIYNKIVTFFFIRKLTKKL